jgi:hypothetical protein
MITLEYIESDHKGAGRDAMQKICDYADVTSQIVVLSADSGYPGIRKSTVERDLELIEFYKSFGFVMSDRTLIWPPNGSEEENVMEREPNDHPATVRVRQHDLS